MMDKDKDPMYYHPFHASAYTDAMITDEASPRPCVRQLPPLQPNRTLPWTSSQTPYCESPPAEGATLVRTPYAVASLAAMESVFTCPISHEIMTDPVVDFEGNSYERAAIVQWLRSGNAVSPLTRSPLHPEELRPNRALKAAIVQFEQLQRATRQRSASAGRR